MTRINNLIFALVIVWAAVIGGFGQTPSNIVKSDLSQAEIDNIIKQMTSHEEEFRYSLNTYVFIRKAIIETIGLGGQVTGTYRRDSFLTFTDDGKRFERILLAPMPTITEIQITPEDLENLGGIDPYALKPSEVSLYNFNYLGKEKIDDLNLYVFDVAPKVIPNYKKTDQRLFLGRIWIDDRDILIVRSKGKAVPEGKQRYPIVDTWRDNIDGKYWFPKYSASDDELVFDTGQVVKFKMRVKYSDYAQGRTSVKVLGEDEPVPSPTPAKP